MDKPPEIEKHAFAGLIRDPLTVLSRVGMGLMTAGALTFSLGFLLADGVAGSAGDGPTLAGLGAAPRAPLDPTATATSTPEPTASPEPPTPTPEPDTPTPEPPAPEPTRPPVRPTSTPRPPAAPTKPPAPPAAPAVPLSSIEQQLYNLHNVERGKAGIAALTLDPTLEAIARQRASDMAAKNYFSHTSPSGETTFGLMAAYGYTYAIAGENIARNNYPDDQSASTAMTGFMNSPTHREIILDPRYTYVGVGAAFGADGMKYFAIVFAGK